MFDPTFIDAIAKLGALGFAIIAVGGLVFDVVRPSKRAERELLAERARVDAAILAEATRRDRREAELVTERNEWRKIAEDAVAKLGRLTDVLEATVGKKLD